MAIMVVVITENVTLEDINKANEYGEYIKVVVDVETGQMAIGGEWHADAEKALLQNGSKQTNLWGGGVDTITHEIDFDSLINVRPGINQSHVILDENIRKKFEQIIKEKFKYE